MVIKILLCSPINTTGGICQWTKNILNYYESQNHQRLKLCQFYPNKTSDNYLNQTSSVLVRLFKGIKRYLPFILRFKNKIKKEHYDIAHLSTSGSISFLRDYIILRLCKKRNIKTVLHFHFGRLPYILKSNSLEKILLDICIPYVDEFITIDLQSFNALSEYRCNNVNYLPNPLSMDIEKIIKDIQIDKRKDNLIVYAGHIVKNKGIFELVDACQKIDNVQLELIGKIEDRMKKELNQIISENNKKRIFIRGNCLIEDVILSMKDCAIFVLPSYSEGFPNVIIESMACGTPIIATNVGAIPEMLSSESSKCGIIIPARDSYAIQSAILTLLEDKELAKEIGQNAYIKVRNKYAISRIWTELENIWMKPLIEK